MHLLEQKCKPSENVEVADNTYIIDGNAYFKAIVHLPETFDSLPKTKVGHFVTDTYKAQSINGLKRNRCGSSATYMIGGPKTKLPKDLKSFLCNSNSKRQLIEFVLNEW